MAVWRLKPGYCLDELHDRTILSAADCYARTSQASIEDLQGGFNIYAKAARSTLCTQSKSDQSVTNLFIDSMFSATTKEEFEEVRAAEVQPTTSYTFLQPPVDDGVLINSAAGYQPMEYLRGNSLTIDAEGAEVV